jgi:ribosomal protein S18 acetylase RimI-like enzyme
VTIDEPSSFRMRRLLGETIAAPIWPDGLRLKDFTPACASDAHALMELAYAKGGGSVPAFEAWWRTLSQDCEYDPSLCFSLYDEQGRLVAFAQCWTGAFVKDLVVHPGFRRRGVGRALLLHIFGVFQKRGAAAVDLKVQRDNPSGAVQLYADLGMVPVSD